MNGRDKIATLMLTLGLVVGNFFVFQNAAPAQVPGPPIPVTIIQGNAVRQVQSSAVDVGTLLEEQEITLGKSDRVTPSLADPLSAHETIRIVRVVSWVQTEHQQIQPRTVHRYVFSLQPHPAKIVSRGNAGSRETLVRYEQRNGGTAMRYVMSSHVVRQPQPRIVQQTTSESWAFMLLARRGLDKTASIAGHAMQMIATAYTAQCGGCSGWTAIGRRAGHGIVAVDPRVIPLGSHLYIPGYGLAIAGDTGGAIHGNRIDLGFDSNWGALQFGRRLVVVYRLK